MARGGGVVGVEADADSRRGRGRVRVRVRGGMAAGRVRVGRGMAAGRDMIDGNLSGSSRRSSSSLDAGVWMMTDGRHVGIG